MATNPMTTEQIDGLRDISAELNNVLARIWADAHGTARQCTWHAEDGWLIVYTTSRVVGGPFHDKWTTMAYKPVGKGARSKPSSWKRVYARGFATRKAAKHRALALYYRHSPNRAARLAGA